MSAEAETNPVNEDWPAQSAPHSGWSWKKTGVIIALTFGAHLAFLFIFATKKTPVPRAVSNVPAFEIGSKDAELIALTDPTLFVVPHRQDFTPQIWEQIPEVKPPAFASAKPLPFLMPRTEVLGATFNRFIKTNQFAVVNFNFKPSPRFSMPVVPAISLLPDNSKVEISGDLTSRQLLTPINAPTLTYNDVIAPSRVQVLVDASGRVVSDVLLDYSGYEKNDHYDRADKLALDLARGARFAPAKGLTFGVLIFRWHTIPKTEASTNSPTINP